jgi:hypothetical protein
MATVQTLDAQTLGIRFTSELALAGVSLRELWFRDHGDHSELWMVTDPIEYDEIRVIARVFVDVRRKFPGRHLEFFVLNPNDFGGSDPGPFVPANATRLYIRDAG